MKIKELASLKKKKKNWNKVKLKLRQLYFSLHWQSYENVHFLLNLKKECYVSDKNQRVSWGTVSCDCHRCPLKETQSHGVSICSRVYEVQWSQQQFQHLDPVWERGIITVSSHCLNRGFSNITAWMKTLDQHLKVVTLRIKTRPVSLWPRTAGSRTWVMTLRSQFWLLFDRRIYVELTERDSSALNRCELKTCQQVH